ncbi:MAG TPA: hypothetical protein VH186_29705 [Chloroflexia bacterium]|nr:hypothetical protein [Chloroflexia bacterium]
MRAKLYSPLAGAWRYLLLVAVSVLIMIIGLVLEVSNLMISILERQLGRKRAYRAGSRWRQGLEGQSTLEWVLIGGMLVVIIVALLTTVFKPQLEAILKGILDLIQQNTGGSAPAA